MGPVTKYQFTGGDQELFFLDQSQSGNIFYYKSLELLGYNNLLRFPFRVVFSDQGISFLYFNPNDDRDEVLFFFGYNTKDYSDSLSAILRCRVAIKDYDAKKRWQFDIKKIGNLRKKWGWEGKQFDEGFSCRILFLHFLDALLQDEEEGSVFRYSSYFNKARDAFRSCLIYGLCLKSQFYNAAIFEQEYPLSISNLDVAGENWLRFITNREHAKYFIKTRSKRDVWFINEEPELRNALKEMKPYKLDRDLSDSITQFFLDKSAIFRALIFQLQQRLLHKRCGGLALWVTLLVFISCLSFSVGYPLRTSGPMEVIPTLLLVTMGLAFSAGCAILVASVIFRLFSYNLLLPKMQLAIVTSLLGILSSVEYFEMGFDMELKGKMALIALVIALVALCYIYYMTKKHTGIADKGNVPFVDFLHIAGKTACVFFLSYAFSLFVSFVGINLVAEQYITNTNFIEDSSVRKNIFELDSSQKDAELFYQNIETFHAKIITNRMGKKGNRIVHLYNFLLFGKMMMFRGFLMITGLFSLFGGILFGLLFENKRISEPI